MAENVMRLFILCVFLVSPFSLWAQEVESVPAVLIADELLIENDRELIARGNVEAFQGETRITADEIRYDRQSGALTITGPIVLQDGEGTTILANAAELDTSLQTGLLTSARLVLDQQLQLAAVQLQRVNSRYSQLYQTAVSSCKVCDDGKPPLWQIRAKRVVHDKEERQLYFNGAQFLILDIPVLYFPQLRLPDPTLERATGFLTPSLRTTSELGTGIKIPYFINLRDDRDLTVTPYVSSSARALELRYRQAFVNGRIEFNGAISRDDIRPGRTRGFLFGNGQFALKNDFRLDFDVEITSDNAFLSNYDFSDKDRLDSAITISRARRDEYISGSVIAFQSLRDGDINSELPNLVVDGIYESRYFPVSLGGEFRINVNGHTHFRSSDADVTGRDVARFNTDFDWLRTWTLSQGLRTELVLGASADVFDISQDSSVPQTETQISPHGSIAFRYPLTRSSARGVTELLEPIVQFGWTGGDRLDIPNEESTRVEFDGGNLLALSRFPEADRRERGLATAFGVNWARFDPNGYETTLTLGQVLREDEDDAFTETSGLTGTTSDYLVAGQIKSSDSWVITARSLFDDSFNFSKAELRGSYIRNRGSLSGSYVFLTQDETEDREDNIAEVALSGAYRVNQTWSTTANWRYDVSLDRASNIGMGVTYNNECVSVDFSVSRDFATSQSLAPTTTLGLSIGLLGFSARKGTETYTRNCGK